MGEVWRARDERLGRDVAIKLLLPHPSNAAERVRAFQHEARAAGTLNHTNVLTVYDVGDHGGAPYLVTECLEGESLRARLGAGALAGGRGTRRRAPGCPRAWRRARARHRASRPEAGEHLPRAGRPREDPRFRPRDAARLGSRTASPSPETSAATARSLVAGTAGYMAPEQVRGEAVDRRADIFALGAVLYEMLAGRRPFKGDSALATLDAVLTLQPPDLSDVNPEISPALSRIVRRCLAKSPDDRFATVADSSSALDSVIQARNPPPPPSLRALLRRPAVMVTGAAGDRRDRCRGLAMARDDIPRSMGAHRCRARDSAALRIMVTTPKRSFSRVRRWTSCPTIRT